MRNSRVAVADLMLDLENPRHPQVTDQRQAIQELLRQEGEKLVALATDIAQHGLSPVDTMLVMPGEGSMFTVLEGNRRLATLKLLLNPGLAGGHPLEKRFRELAARAEVPEELPVAVASSREEGRHWQEIRHTGERSGAGTVGWSAEAQARFAGKRGSQSDRALALIDSVQQAFPDNSQLQADIDSVRKNRLTTLGRLVSDPYFRESLGLEFDDGELLTHYSLQDLEAPIGQVFSDLAGDVTVSQLKRKDQRRNYIDPIKADMATAKARWKAGATPLPPAAAGQPKRSRKKKPTKPQATAKGLFSGLELHNLGSRISAILTEVQSLDVDTYPNACAVLVRSVVELAVAQVYEEKKWSWDRELKKRVKKCLQAVDPANKNPLYQPVRTGLDDGLSLLSVATLHGYVHNPHFHPGGTDLRSITSNYAPFLKALDELV